MLLPNIANPTAMTSVRLLLIMLTSLCICQGKRTCRPGHAGVTFHEKNERDGTHAGEVRLRQVYAALDGMIGGSHKSERRMLFGKILYKVRPGPRSQAA